MPATRIIAPPGSAARAEFVGASEVPAVLGVSPYGSAYTVWARIVYGDTVEATLPMQIGHALEPIIITETARSYGLDLHKPAEAYVVGRLGANLDAVTPDGRVVVEVKAWNDYDKDAVESVGLRVDDIAPGKALAVWWQIQTQIFCSGAEEALLAALCGKRLVTARVYPDRHAQALLQAEVEGFWSAHVATRIAPPADHRDLESLARRPMTSDATVEADDLADLLAERARVTADRDAADDRRKAIDAAVRQRLGDAKRLTAAGWKVSRSQYTTERLEITRLRADHPALARDYTTTTTTDRLTVTPPKEQR